MNLHIASIRGCFDRVFCQAFDIDIAETSELSSREKYLWRCITGHFYPRHRNLQGQVALYLEYGY